MTRVTDRELKLQAEVDRLRAALEPPNLTPDQLKKWREEYRERAIMRALLDEAERARDEVAILAREIGRLNADLLNKHLEIERLRKQLESPGSEVNKPL